MPLAAGARLGPYEILSPLASGGMGEVYRGRDSRLGREVAVKVLPTHIVAGNQAEGEKILSGLLSGEGGGVDSYSVGLVYTALGERDRALEWLAKACDSRSSWLALFAKGDPRLDPLRSDPRFEKIISDMGFSR